MKQPGFSLYPADRTTLSKTDTADKAVDERIYGIFK